MTTASIDSNKDLLAALNFAASTDIGMRREENQDSYGVIEAPRFRFFFVADGMGGVRGGAIASNLAVQIIEDALSQKAGLNAQDICAAVVKANQVIFEKGTSNPLLAGMGTTLSGVAFIDDSLFIINVGDSRVYRIREKEIIQLTSDHTLVMELLRSGAISSEQANNHPVSHMLTRSLGPTAEVQVDCRLAEEHPEGGDIYLICSDGLYNLVLPHEVVAAVNGNELENSVQRLITLANEKGGTDNITVILIRIEDEYQGEESSHARDRTAADSLEPESMAGNNANKVGQNGGAFIMKDSTTVELDQSAAESANFDEESAEDSPEIRAQVLIDEYAEPGKGLRRRAKRVKASAVIADDQTGPPPGEVTDEKPVRRQRSWRVPLIAMCAFGTGIIGALLFPLIVKKQHASNTQPVVASHSQTQVSTAKVAPPVPTEPPKVEKPPAETLMPDISQNATGPSGANMALHVGVGSGLHLDTAGITKRKEELRLQLASLNEKLDTFNGPLSGKFGETLQNAAVRDEEFRKALEVARADLDTATRKLAVWYGRRRRLETTDPVNMASEVAVSAEAVRAKKELFERATWDYLKEVEVLRYNPSDKVVEQKVATLVKQRNDRMKELGDEVRNAIEAAVKEADQAVAELTLHRDQIENDRKKLQRESEFAKAVMSNNPEVKAAAKQDLLREREVAQAEFDELQKLVPETSQ